jgi:hypothetical protein
MSRRRRTRLQRLKRSVVVTFSAAAAGSAGCDALAEPSTDDGRGRPPFGVVAGGVPVPPFMPPITNPPFVDPTVLQPCPSEVPVDGTPCAPAGQRCTYPVVGSTCPQVLGITAQCMVNAWVVVATSGGTCNPPWVPLDAGTPDAGTDEDAGLDDDGGLDVGP